MLTALKVGLGITVLASFSALIGVPISIYSGETSSSLTTQVNAGGGGILSSPLHLTKCEENIKTDSVNFGDDLTSVVCWSVKEPGEKKPSAEKINQSLTDLFKKMWVNSTFNWNAEGHSSWKVVCMSQGKGWTLVQPENGEYLGYCEGNKPQEDGKSLGFLDINKKARLNLEAQKEGISIKLCLENCFKDQVSNNLYKLKEKEDNNWNTIEFFKKS